MRHRWDQVGVAVVLLIVGVGAASGGPAVQGADSPHSLCYAYLLNGDIVVSCGGHEESVTDDGKAAEFAINMDGSSLAVEEQARWGTEAPIRTVELKGNFETRVTYLRFPENLIPSCGTLTVFSGKTLLTYDLTHGGHLGLGPYIEFRCSSDRKIVAGTGENPRKLMEGLAGERTIARREDNRILFDVSPNGRYLAYYDDEQLCVIEDGGKKDCADWASVYSWHLSASDDGEVIFYTGVVGTCYDKDRWHHSLTKRPGYQASEPCPRVAYWAPGEKEPRFLNELGENPLWITPEAAAALRAWAAHNRSERKPPKK